MVASTRARPGTASRSAASPRTVPPTPSRRHSGPTPTSSGPNLVKSYLRNHITKTSDISTTTTGAFPVNSVQEEFPVKSQDSYTWTDPAVRCAHPKASSGRPSLGKAFSVCRKVEGGLRRLPRFGGGSSRSLLVLPGQATTPHRTGLLCQVRQETCRDPLPHRRDAAQRMQWRELLSPHMAITATCFWSPRRTERCVPS